MDYLKNSKDWQSPSFLIWLLHERVKELKSFTKGISEEEFDNLCRNDSFLRKNLILEIRDMETVIKQLKRLLGS
ncbi:MAG: hypothetical protein NUV98_04360 [Candidatus Roizmanbacteria bacterium]|nr:hypothetical protein [Candidatus Roizmanbacteria bacterium]